MKLIPFTGLTRRIRVIIPLLFVIVSLVAYQKDAFPNGTHLASQLASVGSLGCYSQADVTGMEANKIAAESTIYNFNNSSELIDIENKINITIGDIESNAAYLEYLQNNLIPEDVLNAERDEINIVQIKLAEASAPAAPSANAGVCSNPGYYDQSSCEGAGEYASSYCSDANYTDEYSCVNAGWNRTDGFCSNPAYTDRVSCESAGTEYLSPSGVASSEYCSMPGYTDQASCQNAGYYDGTGWCSNSAYYDEYSCTNAGSFMEGWCSVPGYYDQASCVTAGAMSGSCSAGGYADESSCVNAGATPGYCSNGAYSDEYSCSSAVCSYVEPSCSDYQSTSYEECTSRGGSWTNEQSGSCGYVWYAGSPSFGYTWYPGSLGSGQWYPGSFVNFGYTWNPPQFHSYNNTWTQSWYETFTSWFGLYGYTWNEPTYERYGNQWTTGSWSSYGYTWQPTTVQNQQSELEQALADMSGKYMQDLNRNSTYGSAIQYTQETLNLLTGTLTYQTKEKARIKASQADLQKLADDISSEYSWASSHICSDTGVVIDNTTIVPPIVDTTTIVDTATSSLVTNPSALLPDVSTTETVNIVPFINPAGLQSAVGAVASSAKSMFDQNKNSIVPQMKQIQDASTTASLPDILSLISAAKTKVGQGGVLLSKFNEARTSLADLDDAIGNPNLKKVVLQFESAATSLSSGYATYFNTLSKFLTGDIPPPSLYSELDGVVISLAGAGNTFDGISTKLKANLVALANSQSLVFKSVSVSPSPDQINVSPSTNEISIKFNTAIDSYDAGTSTVTNLRGVVVPLYGASLNSARDTVILSFGNSNALESSSEHIASIELQMTAGGVPLVWKKSWVFKTGQEEAINNDGGGFVDAVSNVINTVFNFISSWLDDDEEKGPSCGNNKVEPPEECDSPTDVPGGNTPYCSSSCQIVCPEGMEKKYENGTPACVVSISEPAQCDVLDEMGNSILDVDGKPLVKEGEVACHTETATSTPPEKEKRGSGTCSVCIYGEEGIEQLLCNLQAEKHPGTMVKSSAEDPLTEITKDCPASEYNTYNYSTVEHSHCANYTKAADSLSIIASAVSADLAKKNIDEAEWATNININDAGCFSAGGEYVSGGKSEAYFNATAKSLRKSGFLGSISARAMQVTTMRVNIVDINNLDLATVANIDSMYGQVLYQTDIFPEASKTTNISLASCPPEGTLCIDIDTIDALKSAGLTGDELKKQAADYDSEYPNDAMKCGNGERFYCATGKYKPGAFKAVLDSQNIKLGKWKKIK